MTKNRGYPDEDLAEVSDNPEWTDEQLANARPFAEVFPELAASIRRARGPQKAPTKVPVTMRLDQDVLAAFRNTGAGWQGRMNDALRAFIIKD